MKIATFNFPINAENQDFEVLNSTRNQTFVAGRDNGTLCLVTIALNDTLIEDLETYRVAVDSVDQAVVITGIMGTMEKVAEVTIADAEISEY